MARQDTRALRLRGVCPYLRLDLQFGFAVWVWILMFKFKSKAKGKLRLGSETPTDARAGLLAYYGDFLMFFFNYLNLFRKGGLV
jgi:hypothetical protein